MAIAAVPEYLGTDFSTASPGLRFGMYLQLWGVDHQSKDVSWTTHDITYENRGQDQKKRRVRNENKVSALKAATSLNRNDKEIMRALLQRSQRAFADSVKAEAALVFDGVATAPFTTGLGNEHPLENGFAFLNPYGMPYLPGSGIKGVLRQSARELASGDWGESDWTDAYITALFGPETTADALQRGALSFWDVIPQIKTDSLTVEIMTPHQTHYYQQGETPHDSGSPNPISFLTVPPGSGFTFHVQCNLGLLEHLAPRLTSNNQWQQLLQEAFEHAFNWLGFGAKTAVGYGAMQEDLAKKDERAKQQAKQKEQERLATLDPEELAFEENRVVIEAFQAAFDKASQRPYQPGQVFDSQRNGFIAAALSWDNEPSRNAAAALLSDTLTWGVSKKGKARIKAAVQELRDGGA